MHKCLVETFRYQIWITKGGNSILVIGIELYFLSSQLTTLSSLTYTQSIFNTAKTVITSKTTFDHGT